MLDAIEIETSPHPSASVIWMHGLGADGNDFVPLVPELDFGTTLAIRYIFPHAPLRPVTINNGSVMRAWYDITSLDSVRENEDDVRESQVAIEELVLRELNRGIDSTRLILAGFSQGGALALQTGLRYPKSIAGILALSSYLPLHATLTREANPANSQIPIFMAHGVFDAVIPLALAEASRAQLLKLGYNISWHTYQMAHQVCDPEIADIKTWLRHILMPSA